MRVHTGNVAFEFLVLAGFAVDRLPASKILTAAQSNSSQTLLNRREREFLDGHALLRRVVAPEA